jgi:hypothetical protein
MRGSLISTLLLTVSFISASPALAGDEQVLRFKSSAKVRVAGQDHLVVIADIPRGGHTTRLVVGNKTEGRFDPIPEQADAIKGLHAGDLIQVTAETANGVSALQSITTYSPKPGELSPGGYVFVATKSDDAAHPAVVLSKLGERTNFALQTVKDDKGAAHVDPALASSVDLLKAGDSVWVDAAPGTPAVAIALLPWSEPQQVKLVKIEPAEVGGHKGMAVHLDGDGKAQVASIPGRLQGDKWVSDARLLAAARRSSPGTDVLVRIQIDGDTLWLRDLQPVPQPVVTHTTPQPGNTDNNGLPRPRIPGGGTPGIGGVGPGLGGLGF